MKRMTLHLHWIPSFSNQETMAISARFPQETVAFPCQLASISESRAGDETTEDAPMEIVPLGPGFAAELRGVTLEEIAADAVAYAAARAVFEEHSVLIFRGQDVTDEVQLAFSRR